MKISKSAKMIVSILLLSSTMSLEAKEYKEVFKSNKGLFGYDEVKSYYVIDGRDTYKVLSCSNPGMIRCKVKSSHYNNPSSNKTKLKVERINKILDYVDFRIESGDFKGNGVHKFMIANSSNIETYKFNWTADSRTLDSVIKFEIDEIKFPSRRR